MDFVNPVANEKIVDLLANDFFNSNYDISKLMKTIFSSDWFYEPQNIGIKICSPTELLVRFKKYTGFIVDNNKIIIGVQKVLGQLLFFPPNVAGWKGGRNWIDSATLLLRLSFASRLFIGNGFDFNDKQNYDAEATMDGKKPNQKEIHISSDWTVLRAQFQNYSPEDAVRIMVDYFVQSPQHNFDFRALQSLINPNRKDTYSAALVKLMSYPEFQLI
jgi:uncharacterized protein (DUF1800 family)